MTLAATSLPPSPAESWSLKTTELQPWPFRASNSLWWFPVHLMEGPVWMHNLLEWERPEFKQPSFAAAFPPAAEWVALPARGTAQHFLWERRGKNHGAKPVKGHDSKAKQRWRILWGAGASLAIVLRTGRDLVPHLHGSISCFSGKAVCRAVPRTSAACGISCRAQGGTKCSPSCFHKILESLTLENTSKIIKSNHQPITTMPAKPCPEVPCLHVFWTPPGMGTPPLPWAACSNVWPLFQ